MNAISIPVRIGIENLESLKDARNEIKGLQDDVKTLRDINKNVSFEGQAAEYKTLLNITENNVNDLMRLYHNIDAAETTEDRDMAISQYQSAKNRAVTSIKSIGSELGGFVEMLSSFTEEQTKIFTNGIRKIRPQVAEAFNETARTMAISGTKGTEQLIKSFSNSNTFKHIWGSLQRENPEIFTDQAARQYLKNSFSSMVSKRYVSDYVDWNGKEVSMPSTIKDRLPSLFRGLQLTQNPTRSKMDQNGVKLSNAEMQKFETFIKNNAYLADEAEQAGLIRRSNGRVFVNPNATRNHINAFGGNLVAMFEAGMRGGPGNGINDLENQKFTEKQYNSLLRKTNGSVDYAIYGAKFLQDNFEWVRPTYTKVQTSKNVQGWKDIGEYYSPNRQRSMGVYQFSPSDVDASGKVSITPQKTTAEGYILPNREQYATMKYNMLFDKIENLPTATKKKLGISNFEHNGFNRDIILMNVPVDELEDPSTSQERKEEIAQQLNNVIKAKPKVGKRNYEFIGTTGTQVAFLRKEIKDAIEEGDKDFFYNGESRRGLFGSDAKAAHDAFRAYEYASKWSTDVEPVQRVYGTNLKNALVVGANLQDIAGMDGQNIGSKAFFPETFQSRGQRDKSTTQVIDLDKYFYNKDAPYHNFVDESTGEIVLPNGGWNGGELRIPKGVALIQNKANVKVKHDLEGKSQEEINDFLTQNLRENGYFIKQSASGYNTPTRFISAQEAATMQLGPEARSYFREIGLQRLAELEDPDTVKRILFSGNDYLSQLVRQDESYLSSQEVQDRINEEKKFIYQNMGQGRLMLPSGAGAYAMLSAWIPNVLNDLIGEENLDQTQKSLALGKDAVAFFQSQDEKLQMYRNPSTIEGNIEAINDAASKYTQTVADMLGISEEDKKQLFVAPTASDFLKRMQGADLDSDTAFVRMAKHNTAFAEIMSQIMADTTQRYNLVRENGYTDEAMEAVKARHTKTLDTTGREFGLGDDYNLEHMRWFVNSFGKVGGMGAANAVSMYAAQYPMSERVSKALMASGPHYDKNSIFQQKDVEYWDMTPEEWDIVRGGAPLYQLYRWARDSKREMSPQEQEEAILNHQPIDQVFDYDKFFGHNVNHVNFTSMHDSHGLEAEYQMWAAARRNPTEFRNSIVDWEDVFSHSSFTAGGHTYDPDSYVGKYLSEMSGWRTKKLNQEFLVFEDDLVDRLVNMEQNAVTQIWSDVAKEGFTGKDAIREASERMTAIGIKYDRNTNKAVGAAGHLKAWGLTRSNVSQNGTLTGEIAQLANIYGEDAVFGGAGVEVPELIAKEIDYQQRRAEAQARHDAAVRRKEEAAQKAREAYAKQEADRKAAQEAKKEERQTIQSEPVVQPATEVKTAPVLPAQAQTQPVQQPQPTYKRPGGDHAFVGTAGRRDNSQPVAAPKTPEYLKAEAEEKAAQKELNNIDATIRFNEMLMDMQNYEQSLQSKTSALVRENEDATVAQSYIAKTLGVSGAKIKNVMDFYKENIDDSTKEVAGVDYKTKALMDTSIENVKELAYKNIIEESKRYSGSIVDQLNEDIAKTSGRSKQRELLDRRQEEIAELAGWQSALVNTALDPRTPSSKKQALLDRADQMPQEVAQAIDKYNALVQDMTKTNEAVGKQSLEQLQIEQGLKSKNSLSVISSARKMKNDQLRSTIERQHKEGTYTDEEYQNVMDGLAQLDRRANPAMIALGQGAKVLKTELKSTAGYLTQMFTRRLFQSAISETTNFVKQFDASMNTIQMITLKTDEQISTLGDTLIDKAKEMKVSVAEITQSAATLYRQGLSDQEVDERLGVISKFSKVSGTKVDAATKLITVAMNTGLVQNAETAADIVTALGDNAATNAAEIEKGIEKAGAAAAADGTSFAQLSAMLTAITSTTQIGGNVAGRTLNTIFGRMNKIGTNELIYDENGNAVSGSAVAKLLEEEGIRMYDEYGNKRSSFDTLYALSQKWENLSDAKQQQFANAIAGTRQYSNFAAIMSGMAEGKVGEYLQLAGESEGITDKKYEIYTKSLNASLTDLRNTWDGLVHDMTDSGALTGGLGFLTNFIQGIDKANNSLGGLGVTLSGVLPSLMIMGGLKSGTLVGTGVAAAGLGIAAIISAIGGQKSTEEILQENLEEIEKQSGNRASNISRTKTLNQKGSDRSASEEDEYNRLLNQINVTLSYDDLVNLTSEERNRKLQENANQIIEEAENNTSPAYVRSLLGQRSNISKVAVKAITKAESDYNKGATGLDTESMLETFGINKEQPFTADDLFMALYRTDSSEVVTKIPTLMNIISNIEDIQSFLSETGMNEADLEDMLTSLANVQFNSEINPEDTASYAALIGIKDSKGRSALDLVAAYASNAIVQGEKGNTLRDVVSEQYLPYLKQFGNGLEITDEEYNNIARQLASDYLELAAGEKDEDVLTQLWFDQLNNVFGLRTGDYTVQNRQKYATDYLTTHGLLGERKQQLKRVGLEDVGETGYYIDANEHFVSQEEAVRLIDQYNNQTTTQEVPLYRALFNGKEFANAKSKANIDKIYKSVVDQYLNLQNNVFDMLISADKQKGLGDLKGYIKQSVADGVDEKDLYKNLVYHLSELGVEVSEGYESVLVDYFANDNYSIEQLFKNGIITDNEALSVIQRKLEDYGIRFTGTLADFINSTADEMFKQAEDTTTIKKELEYDKPDLKGIRNIFQGTAAETYKTWASKNQLAINATEALQMINGKNKLSKKLTTIQDMFDYVNENGESIWQVFSQDEEMAPLLLSLERDLETGIITNEATLPSDIIRRLQQLSPEYGEVALTGVEKQKRIQDAVDNLKNGYFVSYSSMKSARDAAYTKYSKDYQERRKNVRDQFTGEKAEEEFNKVWTERFLTEEEWAAKNWIDKHAISSTDSELITNTFGSVIGNKLLEGKTLSDLEQRYYDITSLNLMQGSSMSKRQQLDLALALRNKAGTGEIYSFIKDNKDLAKSYLNGFADEETQNYYLSGIWKSEAYRSDKEKDAIERYDKWYKDEVEKYNYKYANEDNGSKLMQDYMTLVDGTLSERYAVMHPYVSQASAYANAQSILSTITSSGTATSEERKALATVLGLEDKDIKEYMDAAGGKRQLQKLLDDKTGLMFKELAEKLNVDLTSDTLELDMKNAAAERGADVLDQVNAFFDLIESFTVEANGDVTARTKQKRDIRAGDYYAQAEEDYEKQTRTARAASWVNQYRNEIEQLIGQEYTDTDKNGRKVTRVHDYESALNEIASKYSLDPEIMAEYWNVTRVGLNKAAPDLLELYDNAQISGGKYKHKLDQTLLKTLFGDYVSDTGKFDTVNVAAIGNKMLEATQDKDSGIFTLWSILAGSYTDLQNALQAFTDNDLTSAQKALEEFFKVFDSDRLDEILKYTDVSKNFKNSLVDLAKGGVDAELAILDINDALSEEYNRFAALTNVKGKAGKNIKGQDLTYFLSATGRKKADIEDMDEAQITSLASTYEKKGLKTIQDELVALVSSAGVKLDYSKVKIGEDGKIDISAATEGLEDDVKEQWNNITAILNKAVSDDYIKIDFPVLFGLAGYNTGAGNIESLVDKDQLEEAKKILFKTLDDLYSTMTKEERDNLTFKSDFTIDTSNLKADQKALVQQWNAYCKANPLVAQVALAQAGGSVAGAQSIISSGGYSTYGEAFDALMQMDESELNKMSMANDLAVAMTGKTAYTKKSSGGGGEDPLTKLLREIEFKIKQLEHERKMAQIEQTKQNRLNNRSGYFAAIEQEISAIQKLKTQQQDNIKQLEEQQKNLDKSSEKYMTVTNKINEAREAIANYSNEISEARAKQIEYLQKEQEIQDKPGAHLQSIIESYAQRALNEDRFADYERFSLQKIEEVQKQRAENDAQLETWKNELNKIANDKNEGIGSDNWQSAVDRIYEIEAENAELDNQLVEAQLELNSQRLSQVAKTLQQNTQTTTHNQNIASIYSGLYQSGGYRDEYDRMLKTQIENNKLLIAENKAAESSATERMVAVEEELGKNTTAWFEAQAAVYQYQETIEQLNATQIELNKNLAESALQKVSEDYIDATREISHVNELLSTQAQEYLSTNDYTAYFAAMERYMDNLPAMIEAERTALSELQTQYNEGIKDGSLDFTMQRQYQNEINNRETSLQKLLLEQRQKEREINKAALDKMFEDQSWAESEYEHNMKLVGYQSSIYQNNGELTNVNNMIRAENDIRQERVKTLQNEIAALEEQHDLYRDGSDDEQRIVEQIKKKEEALEQENVQLDKNNKLMDENEKKIAQLRKTLVDAVDKEIEDEKKRQREILSANVSMQDSIVSVLKKRLQDEWNLKKKDIEKEKESLAEYKNLINERFNYRKNASQQADKEEELADYRRQLALIEADPTRTKDAKELRRKIEELEKEQAWQIAEAEVSAESERIDDQVQGMDRYLQYNEELLNEVLSDANNFAVEMNDILSGSFEEAYAKIIAFMSKENEAFMKSLPDAQQQMIQSWEDTTKKAKDYIDTNYPEIYDILQSKDTYLEQMKNTDEYRKAVAGNDTDEMARLEREYSDLYDDWFNATKDNAEIELHSHNLSDVVSKVDELKDNEFNVNIVGINGQAPESSGFSSLDGKTTDFSTGKEITLTEIQKVFETIEKVREVVNKAGERRNEQQGGYKSGGVGQKETLYFELENGTIGVLVGSSKEDIEKQLADLKKKENVVATNENYIEIPTIKSARHLMETLGLDPFFLDQDYLFTEDTLLPDYDTGVDSGHGTNILARIPDADYLDKIAKAYNDKYGDTTAETALTWARYAGNVVSDILGYDYDIAGNTANMFEAMKDLENGTFAEADDANDPNKWSAYTNESAYDKATNGLKKATEKANEAINAAQKAIIDVYGEDYYNKNIKVNAEGGLVDYTGLAWVDGTKTKPESFLDATDTKLLRSMLDSFEFVKTSPYMSHVDTSAYSNNTTVGDINITINEAEINSDMDVNNLAKRVGQAFTRELQHNGLNLSGYAFG